MTETNNEVFDPILPTSAVLVKSKKEVDAILQKHIIVRAPKRFKYEDTIFDSAMLLKRKNKKYFGFYLRTLDGKLFLGYFPKDGSNKPDIGLTRKTSKVLLQDLIKQNKTKLTKVSVKGISVHKTNAELGAVAT